MGWGDFSGVEANQKGFKPYEMQGGTGPRCTWFQWFHFPSKSRIQNKKWRIKQIELCCKALAPHRHSQAYAIQKKKDHSLLGLSRRPWDREKPRWGFTLIHRLVVCWDTFTVPLRYQPDTSQQVRKLPRCSKDVGVHSRLHLWDVHVPWRNTKENTNLLETNHLN